MIENYRSGLIWRLMQNDPVIRRGLRAPASRADGWAEAPAGLLPCGPLALLLGACGHRRPKVEVLHFWAMGDEAEVLAQLLPEFERTHPLVHVEVQQLAWTAAHEKLLTAIAGDATPDLCQLGNTWIPELVALHALAPLAGARRRIARRSSADDYFPGVWQTNVLDGALYGVPWYVDTRLLFYRSDLLQGGGLSTRRRLTPGRTGSRRCRPSSAWWARIATRCCCR